MSSTSSIWIGFALGFTSGIGTACTVAIVIIAKQRRSKETQQ